MKVITDLGTLKKLEAKVPGLVVDRKHRYVATYGDETQPGLSAMGYRLRYFDGCFHPYITAQPK